jgi:MFS family permease
VGAASAAVIPSTGLLRRNLLLDLATAVGMGITTALVASLLPSVSRRAGLDPIGLAFLASAPFVANLLGLFAGRLGPRTTRQLAATRAAGAALLLVLVFAPAPIVLTAVAIGFWLSISFATPLQQRIWGAMYPVRERGRLIGKVATGRAAAAGTAALIGGVVADQIGGLAVVAIAGMVGAICATSTSRLRVPLDAAVPVYSARASWQTFRRIPALRQVGTAQAFFGGGLIAAAPLYALVQVDRLSLSLTEIGTIGILASLATTISCLAWGSLADRRGAMPAMQIGSALGFLSLLLYAVAPSVLVLWLAAICVGLANAAIDLGISSVLSEHTTLEERAAAMSGFNALTGARGIVAPFVASGLVQSGLMNITGALLLCAATTGIGALLYLRLSRGGEPRSISTLVHETGVHRGLRRARALVVSAAVRG